MINFDVIRWRNFLSTGNAFTEIKLNESNNALIIGENGAGKSTILDALTFALFGKPFRNINKPSLINSVNQKNCVVEIEFKTNGKEYKIIRGIKPTIFEIYCDDVLLNQDSASKDYQEYLESFILKMNYKSFTQIVILGSASFTPFMQLSPADRRVVIEDLLDIQIFSVMNVIAKQKLQENKELLEKNRLEIKGKEEKRLFIEKTIKNLKNNNEEKLLKLEEEYASYNKEIEGLDAQIKVLVCEEEELLEKTVNHSTFREKHNKLIALQSKIDNNLTRQRKEIYFYRINDNCPTCHQSIDSEFKDNALSKGEQKVSELEKGLEDINKNISDCINQIDDVEKILSKIQNIRNEINISKTKRLNFISSRSSLQDNIEHIKHSDKMLMDNQEELNIVEQELESLQKEKDVLVNNKLYIETAINLLKDGGIKTKIIKQYLPIINKLINKYLSQMGFFVNFNINEQFEETIKSRYRDEFSYENFSEGEKQKIDLSLLFTWRAIARMRNSCSTNLLLFDEVFDSSLDQNGVDNLLTLLKSSENESSNIFVISHRNDTFLDKFNKVYRFIKRQNFSSLAA
jgi:DNA repair exonuclease SbcCD ATPase subunit